MIIRIATYVSVVFFIVSFLACAKDKNHNEGGDSKDKIPPSDWNEAAGFFLSKDHTYGFDRHPSPGKNSEDSIVYISVLKNSQAVVNLRMNKEFGFEYFICDPDNIRGETGKEIIDVSLAELRYEFTATEERKIALCRENKGKIEKLQELHIYPYEWKNYDFDVYTFGNSDVDDDRHRLVHREPFWNKFDSIFGQAVVRHGELFKKFKTYDKEYVLTRVEGNYPNKDACVLGDIEEFIDDIFRRAYYEKYYPEVYPIYRSEYYSFYGEKKRAVIQVAYPTKRFWPLKEGENGNIEICGNPKYDAANFNLELESISSRDCPSVPLVTTKTSVSRDRNVWKLNGTVIANKNNVDIKCMVFAETSKSDYVGEVGEENLANAIPLEFDELRTYVALLPWSEKDKDELTGTAIHELGHTIGLKDLNDNPLSCIPDKQSGIVNSATGEYKSCIEGSGENNIMHYRANSKDYKLRNRSIKGEYINKKESQWKCLQRIDVAKNCIDEEKVLFVDEEKL
jgi:hypothetical protein